MGNDPQSRIAESVESAQILPAQDPAPDASAPSAHCPLPTGHPTSPPRRLLWWLLVGTAVFAALWWFPIPLDTGHRDAYFRRVLRVPAMMWAACWLLVTAVVLSRRKPGRWKTRGCEVLLALTALALPLGALETYYRWMLPTVAGAGDPYDLCTGIWLRLYDPNAQPPPDPRYAGQRRFRDAPEDGPKPAGQSRVLFLGDSVTWGWGVHREEDLMSRVTETLLRQQTGWDVLTGNIAAFNVDTKLEQELLRRYGLRWQPDVLVLVYDLSDITGEAGPAPSHLRQPGPVERWLIQRSFLFSRLYWTRAFASGLSESHLDWLIRQYHDAQIWPLHAQSLRSLIEDCRARKVKVLVVLAPFLSAVEHYPEGLRDVHRRVAELVRQEGATVLDGLDWFAGTRSLRWMVNRADRHPNAAAHRRFAEQITPVLVDLLAKGSGP